MSRRWGVAAAVFAGCAVMVGLLVVFGVMATTVRANFRYQCESAGVRDPSASATVSPAPHGGEPAGVSATPSANPFASLQPDDGDPPWVYACSTAMKHAPYQGPPLHAIEHGPAAECAARLAVGQVGRQLHQVSLVRFVIYHASTGRCEAPPPAADLSADAVAPTVDLLPPSSTCPDSMGVMLMPDTVAAQGFCGQIVDPTAVWEGDLVFLRLDDSGPTRVGIAVGSTELVTADETTGLVERQQIPEDDDVLVKRVLPIG